MNALQKTIMAIVIIIIFIIGIAYILPASWNIQRSIVINAPFSQIDPYVQNLKLWPKWTPWSAKADPGLKFAYEGPASGKGAISKWFSTKMGSGILTITKAAPQKGIWYKLDMSDGEVPSSGSILFERENAQTKVVWSDTGELGKNPINRYLGLLIASVLEVDFETGLAQLKKLVENQE